MLPPPKPKQKTYTAEELVEMARKKTLDAYEQRMAVARAEAARRDSLRKLPPGVAR